MYRKSTKETHTWIILRPFIRTAVNLSARRDRPSDCAAG